jgi:hypothetical protein
MRNDDAMGRSARVRRMLAAGAAVLVATGCGSASDPSPPAGVDGLVIPTPTPDRDDFVAGVDNPWLPLKTGATWTYESGGEPSTRLSVAVEEGPTIAGVATTAVRSLATPAGDGEVSETVDYYAQDTEGNVWWFGREGEWRADEDGAQAGVAMLDRPRFGDGYREALADGVVDRRSEIVAVDGVADVPAGEYDDVLVVETESPVAGSAEVTSYYARGIGLVLRETDGAPDRELGLVAHE